MALTFAAATTDRVDCGASSVLANINAGAIGVLCMPTESGSGARFLTCKGVSAGDLYLGIVRAGATGADVYGSASRTTTRDLVSSLTIPWILGMWHLFIFQWDLTTPTTPRMFFARGGIGPFFQRTIGVSGSGTKTDDSAAPFMIGNESLAADLYNLPWKGGIAWTGIWNRTPTLAEWDEFYANFDRHPAGCVGSWLLGQSGTGTQRDLSGYGNHGTTIGTTYSRAPALDSVFMSKRSPWSRRAAEAAAAARLSRLPLMGVG